MIRKILVVDDSQLLHKMYELVLRRYVVHGTTILHAYDGVQALDLAGIHTDIDLILLDVNMPNMNGIEFLRLRNPNPVLACIPVIVISTEGKERDATLALSEGAADYLTKPFDPSELHAKIELILDKWNGANRANG